MSYVWQDAREQAQLILDEYWDQETLPIDIMRLCRLNHVIPLSSSMLEGRSGMIVKRAGEDTARAYADSLEPLVRRRFTFAHELGHYVERRMAGDVEYGFNDYRPESRSEEVEYFPHEFFADEFAGALLMPESKVEEFREQGLSERDMAKRFEVSVAAMRQRLHTLERTRTLTREGRFA